MDDMAFGEEEASGELEGGPFPAAEEVDYQAEDRGESDDLADPGKKENNHEEQH